MSKHEEEEEIQLSTPELHGKFLEAKTISDELLKKLDLMNMDLKRIESFLIGSGFSSFSKTYTISKSENVFIDFDGKSLRYRNHYLKELSSKQIMQFHALIPDFLESIAKSHVEVK